MHEAFDPVEDRGCDQRNHGMKEITYYKGGTKMKETVFYSKVERKVYELSNEEVKDAIVKYLNIDRHGKGISLESFDSNGKEMYELTMMYEYDKEVVNGNQV